MHIVTREMVLFEFSPGAQTPASILPGVSPAAVTLLFGLLPGPGRPVIEAEPRGMRPGFAWAPEFDK